MVAFLLFLIVFAISYNNGRARAIIDGVDEIITRNGIKGDGYRSDGTFKLPTVIKQGLTITVNGILNRKDKLFKVVFRDSTETDEDCKFIFDFENETINITSAQDNETESYSLRSEDREKLRFSLIITARKKRMAMSLQVNKLGPSSELTCDIENFQNINYIEIQNGLVRMDSLLFEFK